MRKLLFHVSLGFAPLRWCLFAVVVPLVAVVGVCDAIDLSASVAITFSSFETVFVLLSDATNVAYIFLPLYLFVVCGLANQGQLGYFQLLRHKSRGQWLAYKWLTLVVYTVVFFVALLAIVSIIAYQAFPYQTAWSTDFINLQVSQGQAVSNFVHSPALSIGASLVSNGLLYLFAGSLAMVCGLKTRSEALSLLVSMAVGLGLAGLCTSVWFVQKNVTTQTLQGLLFAGLWLVLVGLSVPVAGTMDFQFGKKGAVR